MIVVWAASYKLFVHGVRGTREYTDGVDTWQLVINTATTIVTFLMVFLIQNTQNRDTTALQVKLDALIFATRGAKNQLAAAEHMSDEELEQLHEQYHKRAEETLAVLHHRSSRRGHAKRDAA